jgi:hypothetical protein
MANLCSEEKEEGEREVIQEVAIEVAIKEVVAIEEKEELNFFFKYSWKSPIWKKGQMK